MKSKHGLFLMFLSAILTLQLFGCGSGSSSTAITNGVLTKLTPLLQDYIPQYNSSKSAKNWAGNFDLDTSGEDSYIYRYLADDINSVYVNALIYDTLVDLVNSKIDINYNAASGVTVSTTNSFTTDATGTVSGDFHEINMGTNLADLNLYGISIHNVRLLIEKTDTIENVYAFIEFYNDGEASAFESCLYTCNIQGDTIKFELYSYEFSETFRKRLAITKLDSGSFTIKEYSGDNSSADKNKGIVSGNMTSTYIRYISEGAPSDECFQIDSETFTKLAPATATGTEADWGGSFPAAVSDSDIFPGYNLDTSVANASSLKWW